jgi:hypothetical protein
MAFNVNLGFNRDGNCMALSTTVLNLTCAALGCGLERWYLFIELENVTHGLLLMYTILLLHNRATRMCSTRPGRVQKFDLQIHSSRSVCASTRVRPQNLSYAGAWSATQASAECIFDSDLSSRASEACPLEKTRPTCPTRPTLIYRLRASLTCRAVRQ